MGLSILTPFVLLVLGSVMAAAVTGRRETGGLERVLASLAWGPGLVAGVVSLTTFFGQVVGSGPPGRGDFFGLLVALTFSVWVAVGLRDDERSMRPAIRERCRVHPVILWCVPTVFVVGYGWSFTRWLADGPLGGFDAMGIWTYRALQWYRSGAAFPDTLGMLLESKPGYPLLVPGLITSQFSIWGGETVVIPIATGGLFVVGLGAMTTLAVLRWSPLTVAMAAAALVLSTPMVWCSAFLQGADLPLAYFTLGGAFGLMEVVFRGSRAAVPAWLAGFFLGLMVWTKNEGLVLAGILVVVVGIVSVISRAGAEGADDMRGGSGRLAVGVGLGALPGVVAMVIFKAVWAPTSEAGRFLSEGFLDRLTDPSRWIEVGVAFLARLVPASGEAVWGASIVLLAGVLGLALMKPGVGILGRETAVSLGAVTLAAGFFFVAYLITPDPLSWHLRTSIDRLLLQVFPLAVAGVFVAFGRVWCGGGDAGAVR